MQSDDSIVRLHCKTTMESSNVNDIMAIKIQKITFQCCCETEARLPGYLGSTLRGSLGWALKKTSCALRRRQCDECLLREQCAYAWTFETQSYKAGDGRMVTRPHPFVLQPGENTEGERQPGETFSFSLLLIDRAVDLLPQIVYSVQLMGESGIGSGRRHGLGRFSLEKTSSGSQTMLQKLVPCCISQENNRILRENEMEMTYNRYR